MLENDAYMLKHTATINEGK